jgi:hypothetical protein
LKRYRDIAYEDKPELAPISIVLTTLAAHHYGGEDSVSEAMGSILRGILREIPRTGRLYVLNPTNPLEDLSERWETNPEVYEAFKDGIYQLRDTWWRLLDNSQGLPGIAKVLEELFGEKRAQAALLEQTKALSQARTNGQLGIQSGSGLIVVSKAANVVEIPRNNFYGD